MENATSYWMAFAHAKGFSTRRKMQFLIECVHGKSTLPKAIDEIKSGNLLDFQFKPKELEGLKASLDELPNYSFLAERLEAQRIAIMNVMDTHVYPKTLKQNLKRVAPIIIYGKGNMDLLKRECVAIVGARKSGAAALSFTDHIAKKSVKEGKVIVSGFAKGVDKQALDSTLKYGGQSIMVLPQGIDTYRSKAYYENLVSGNALFMSTYHPSAPWSVGRAMDRNKTIYGLADSIYAAESNDKGGTWEGVLDGLKRGRTIYVRYPQDGEKNANLALIERGAIAVDENGETLTQKLDTINDPHQEYGDRQSIESDADLVNAVLELIGKNDGKGVTTNEIKKQLDLSSTLERKISKILSSSPKVEKRKKGRSNLYVKKIEAPKLF